MSVLHMLSVLPTVSAAVLPAQEAMRLSPSEREQLLQSVAKEVAMPVPMTNRPQCSVCKRMLPTEHLLALHLEESHDSFFAAQVARGMKVFQCLVEGCGRRFPCPHSRKQHLLGVHHFPKCFDFDALHVKRRSSKGSGGGGGRGLHGRGDLLLRGAGRPPRR
mmetsp:Transcript_28492/g.73179  ORF Transcript_28492/g.73179 Transcript_28492/m.73179 type:complete len:162 (+) Transcript_28492:192-677(+)